MEGVRQTPSVLYLGLGGPQADLIRYPAYIPTLVAKGGVLTTMVTTL